MNNLAPLRVLFVSHTPNLIGGADLCLQELLENLDRSAVLPHVVLPLSQTSAQGVFSKTLNKVNISHSFLEIVHWVDFGFYGKVSRFRLILRFLRGLSTRVRAFISLINNENIDIVYTN